MMKKMISLKGFLHFFALGMLVMSCAAWAQIDDVCATRDEKIAQYQPKVNYYHHNSDGMFVRILERSVFNEMGKEQLKNVLADANALLNEANASQIKLNLTHYETLHGTGLSRLGPDLFSNTLLSLELMNQLVPSLDYEKVLNIIFTDSVSLRPSGSDKFTECGYVQTELKTDFILMFNKNECLDENGSYATALAHQLGHFFGLKHTHAIDSGTEYVDRDHASDCSITGDGFCDTASDPDLKRGVRFRFRDANEQNHDYNEFTTVTESCEYAYDNVYYDLIAAGESAGHINDQGYFQGSFASSFWSDANTLNRAIDYLTDPDYLAHQPDPSNIMSSAPLRCLTSLSEQQAQTINQNYQAMLLSEESKVEDVNNLLDVSVFPNPSPQGQEVKIRINNSYYKELRVRVYDVNGRYWYNKRIVRDRLNSSTVSLPSNLPAGIYFYRIAKASKNRTETRENNPFGELKGTPVYQGRIVIQ